MEQLLALLVGLAILGGIGVGLALGVVAYARANALRREVALLRGEVERVRAAEAHARRDRAAGAPSVPVGGVVEAASRRAPAPLETSELRSAPTASGTAPESGTAETGRTRAPETPPLRAASADPAAAAGIRTAGERDAPPTVDVPRVEAAAAEPARAPVLAPPLPPKKRAPIEKILGVTGAAVLGGIVLAIAGFYLYQYSVQQGWVTKEVRLAMGIVAGVLSVLGSWPLKKRGYDVTADALAGGGIVVLYSAFWAAHHVFGVWDVGVSFGAMIATTAFCCWLSNARKSQVVAGIGLVGGFATPIVLSTGGDHPIGLFGYTLLVNLGFLSVAHKRRWPVTAMLALVGTFVIEALWVFTRLRGDTFWIGLVAVAVFAFLFVGFTALQPNEERRRFVVSQTGALLMPFVFALYFAVSQDESIGYHVAPIAALSALMLAASGWLALKQGALVVPLGTAAGSVAVVLAWVLTKDLELARSWELAACCAGLSMVMHVVIELGARRGVDRGVRDPLVVSGWFATLGFGCVLFLAAWKNADTSFAPWCAGLGIVALLAARLAAVSGGAWIAWAGAIPSAAALVAWSDATNQATGPWISDAPLVWALAIAAALHMVSFLQRDPAGRRALAIAVVMTLAAGLYAVPSAFSTSGAELELALTAAVLVGAAIAFAARRAQSTAWFAVGALLSAHEQGELVWRAGTTMSPTAAGVSFGLLALGAATYTGLASLAWLDSRMLARVRAASAWLWLPALGPASRMWLGDDARGLGALVLGAVVLAGWWRQRVAPGAERAQVVPAAGFLARIGIRTDGSARTPFATARTWSLATALCFALLVVPIQLDQDAPLVGAVFCGAGLAWLARRQGHRPLAIVATAVLVLGALCLIAGRIGVTMPVYPRAFANWLAWLYLAPACAAVLATGSLHSTDSPPPRSTGITTAIAALTAVVLGFAWIHLAILDAFDTSPSFEWHPRAPARDMTLSLAWGMYAFALLILGVSRRASGLRWTSLVLFLATIAKTFLFDLGHLTGLHRVASLFGLALTLLAVSLLYQRFVFRKSPEEPAPSP